MFYVGRANLPGLAAIFVLSGQMASACIAPDRPFLPEGGFAGIVERPPRKPLIAAVEGHALAGGFEIALSCDLLVASQTARFGIPEVRRGLIAAAGGLLRLPTVLPKNLAMELALTGRFMAADEAWRAGLLNRLVEPGTALDVARALALEIAANAPLSVAIGKQIIRDGKTWPEADMFVRQKALADAVLESQDAQEGARAFAEKRAPVWRGC